MTTNSKTIQAITASILLIAIVFSYICPSTQAQTNTTFSSADKFAIPPYNGVVSFAVNGSCTEAVLENDTWTFKGLTLNNSRPLGNLKVSAQNSNVTIIAYFSGNYNSRRLGYLRVYVEGQGKQAFNLGFNTSSKADASEWTVITDGGAFLAEGEGWKLLEDETVVLAGSTGSLTIARYGYGLGVDDRPFYMHHSIIILTGVAVAVTVAVATVIRFKGKVRS